MSKQLSNVDPVGSKHFRVIILGAGFSCPAGLPSGPVLSSEIFERAYNYPEGRFGNAFRRDFTRFIEYQRLMENIEISEKNFDFEDFISFLDIEHFLGLRGSDTWSKSGNETQVLVKWLIGRILYECMPSELPSTYRKFAELLEPEDMVLTFNYDTLLEQSLESLGKPYRLFPDRYSTINEDGSGMLDGSREEVIILKLHGSMDWFDRSSYEYLAEDARKRGFKDYVPSDPIFGPEDTRRVSPVIENPPGDHPLKTIYRLHDLDRAYKDVGSYQAIPWILSPSRSKVLYTDSLRDFWYGMGRVGAWNFGMAIIGYSLPSHDEYLRLAIYTMVRNYLKIDPGFENLGRKKTKLALIDFRQTESDQKSYRDRYRFVDWDNVVVDLNGFSEETLPLIFQSGVVG